MYISNSLEIELTTKCTLGCSACPRNDPKENREDWDVGHIDLQLVKNIIDQDHYKSLLFVGCYGDPIYHPDFIEICHYAIAREKRLLIHTNGSYKKQKWWDELAKADWKKYHNFTFSVDGLEDTNGIYRERMQWSSIIAGMQAMSKTNATIEWKMLVFPYNIHQVPEARRLAESMGIRFTPVTSERGHGAYKHETPEIFMWKNNLEGEALGLSGVPGLPQ